MKTNAAVTRSAPAIIQPRAGTKKDRLVSLLSKKAGADVAALSAALGWQAHTTRAALTRLRQAGFPLEAAPDRSLTRLLAQAHRFRDLALKVDGRSMGDLAREAGVTPSCFTRVLRIGFLSPTLVRAILDGRQPRELHARRLIEELPGLPIDWAGQKDALGFA